MRVLGWVFLSCYLVDAVVSGATLFAPGLLGASNLLSTAMIPFCVVVVILAGIDKLRPRSVFLILPLYDFVMLAFGFILGIALVFVLGPARLAGGVTPEFIRSELPWFGLVQAGLLVVWLCLAVFGVVRCALHSTSSEESPKTTPNGEFR